MNYAQMLKPAMHSVPVYEPGRPIEVVARELGLDPDHVAKMASNENPLGSSPKGLAAAHAALSGAWMYPENSAFFLRGRIAEKMGLEPSMISVCAGSNEVFYLMGDLFLAPGVEVVMSKPSFITGMIATLLYGSTPVAVPVRADLSQDLDGMLAAITERTRIVYLPDPNNPTGTICSQAELDRFITALPDHVVLIYDEAYREYRSEIPDIVHHIRAGRKVVGTRTFSKIYGMAGLRVGYAYCAPEMAALLDRVRPPFSVSVPALAAGLAAIDDDEWVLKCRVENTAGLAQLRAGLEELGLSCVDGEANFVLVKVGPEAMGIFQKLQGMGWIVRPVKNYGLPDYLRISVGTREQNAGLLVALREVLARTAGL
ncbi:MAG: histidinol-phosphate transaminase [Opitutales bacterium]